MRIAFIGFGEAARAFAASLAGRGVAFSAYDILQGGPGEAPVRRAAAEIGVALAPRPGEAAAGADWVISAVTAEASLEAARSVAGSLRAGQVFFDVNSVSAGRKQATAALVSAGGAVYLDMAVMAPVHPKGHRTPCLLAGRPADGTLARLAELGFAVEHVGPEIGTAATMKLVRSLFVKGLEAITVEALMAAEAAGCLGRTLASLEGSYPGLGWPDFAAHVFERVAVHGVRRAAEMRESAVTMRELGTGEAAALADAIAAVQGRIGALHAGGAKGEALPDRIARLRALRREAGG